MRYESDDVIWLRNDAYTWILVPNIGCKQTMASNTGGPHTFLVFTHFCWSERPANDSIIMSLTDSPSLCKLLPCWSFNVSYTDYPNIKSCQLGVKRGAFFCNTDRLPIISRRRRRTPVDETDPETEWGKLRTPAAILDASTTGETNAV